MAARRLAHLGSRAAVLAGALAAAALAVTAPGAAGPARPAVAAPAPAPALGVVAALAGTATPPTTARCLAVLARPCYDAGQLRRAYDADTAQRLGLTGAGATVLIVEAYGDPSAQADLDAYDAAFGLPPADVRVLKFGDVPAAPVTADERLWAVETALDLEAAHTMAPGARLLLAETDTDETTGTTGFPQIMDAVSAVVSRYRVDVVSMSFGAAEQNFPDQLGAAGDYGLLYGLRYGLRAAARHGATLLASTGDTGPTGFTLPGTGVYPFRTVEWPASDPLVTAVGGSTLHLDAAGDRTGPDTAWDDVPAGSGAGGGGLSAAFARPPYQAGVAGAVGEWRGVPDVVMNASCDALITVYSTYQPSGRTGWLLTCGTSEAVPLLAGLVADAAALARHPLGNIDGALYRLARDPRAGLAGLADITTGCTDDLGVAGYCAGRGYDLATGVGTVGDATRFIAALAAGAGRIRGLVPSPAGSAGSGGS